MASIRDLFNRHEHEHESHTWALDAVIEAPDVEQLLAERLADRIMEYRCRARPDVLEAWRVSARGGVAATGTIKRLLCSLAQTSVGLQEQPRTEDHVQAFVAEHLWYFALKDVSAEEDVLAIEGPSSEVTEQGGDGLVIHGTEGQPTLFRLWELKKHSGQSPVNRTVNGAYRQLQSSALRYLNKYSLNGQYQPNEALQRFYALLPEYWVESRPEAAAGVSVMTSTASVPGSCYSTFPNHFPDLTIPRRLRGLLAAVEDLPRFSLLVQEEIWRGL